MDDLFNITLTFGIFIGIMLVLISTTYFIKLLYEISSLKSQKRAYDLMSKDEAYNVKLGELELKEKQAEARRSRLWN